MRTFLSHVCYEPGMFLPFLLDSNGRIEQGKVEEYINGCFARL